MASTTHLLQSQFLSTYEAHLPSGQIWITCFDFCEMTYLSSTGEIIDSMVLPYCNGISESGLTVVTPGLAYRHHKRHETGNGGSLAEWVTCDQDWNPLIATHLFRNLPVMYPICIGRISAGGWGGGSYSPRTNQHQTPFAGYIHLVSETATITIAGQRDRIGNWQPTPVSQTLAVEAHELCHANQEWNILQEQTMQSGHSVQERPRTHEESPWDKTSQARSFVRAIGFTRDDHGRWRLPASSRFRDWYGGGLGGWASPLELAAELCRAHFMSKLNPHYRIDRLHRQIGRGLSEDVMSWLEEYVWVLPLHVADESADSSSAYRRPILVKQVDNENRKLIMSQLVDAAGDPISEANVGAQHEAGTDIEQVTDVDGSFTFAGPSRGSYRLYAWIDGCLVNYKHGGATGLASETTRIVVGESDGAVLRFQLAKGMCETIVSGRLLNADGSPRAKVPVWAWDGQLTGHAYTRLDGSFSFAVPENGSYRLSASVDDCLIFYGTRGPTNSHNNATQVAISGADVTDIEFRLPRAPSTFCD